VQGKAIYLMECLWSWAWMNITRWNLEVIDSGQIHSDGRCGCRGLNRGLDRIAADGPWGVVMI